VNYQIRYPERKVSWREQIDPRWWIQTADNPEPPRNYPGSKTQWLLRNFGHNFRRYVVGVSHVPRIVCGSMIETGNAFRQPSGILWGITFAPWLPPLPYLSLRIRRPAAVYDFAIGWSAFGMLMLKARRMRPGAFDWE
jgi:hypothetical protein